MPSFIRSNSMSRVMRSKTCAVKAATASRTLTASCKRRSGSSLPRARWISSFRSSRSSKSSSAISTLNIQRFLHEGQIDDDLRAPSRGRVLLADPDPARMEADHVFGEIEPLPPPLPGSLALVKTLVRLLIIHPRPLVAEGDRHVLPPAVPVLAPGHDDAGAGLVRLPVLDGVVDHVFKHRPEQRRGGKDHGHVGFLADRDIGQVAILGRDAAKHRSEVNMLELDEARLALVGDLLEDLDVGEQLVEIVVDARPGVLREAGKQVDPSLDPAEIVLELMPDGGGDIADELVSPRPIPGRLRRAVACNG